MRGSKPKAYETPNPDGGADTVTVYPDGGGLWRWRRKSPNGRIIADGSEGYSRKDAALRAALRTNPPKPRLR